MYTGNSDVDDVENMIITVYPCVYRELFQQPQTPDYSRGLSLCIQGTLFNIFLKLVLCFGLSLCIQGTLDIQWWYAEEHRFIPVYTGNS